MIRPTWDESLRFRRATGGAGALRRIVCAMRVCLRDVSFAVTDCTTRLPFRFGMNTMTWAPTLTARVELETDAGDAVGYSADLLVPKWFEKDPHKSLRQDVEGLMASAQAAGQAARSSEPETVFDLWWRTWRARVDGQPFEASDRLLRGFGVALVERALLDAACRAADTSFFEACKSDLFGLRPELVHPELAGWSLADSLPAAPSAGVALRHTIGLVDHLRSADVPEDERVGDGLPEALEEDVHAYGLSWFKLKLGGDRAVDLERTLTFAELVRELVGEGARVTVDGNEQFAELGPLVDFLRELDGQAAGRFLLERLVCIEQPLPRSASFEESARPGLAALREIAPVIIDEADSGIGALPRALELGYSGVSVKNCKGVLRALLARGLCERQGGFQSAEDLTNLGVLALQQDLTTVATLGLEHVERNGHHYFLGLNHLSEREARGALERHPELWERADSSTSLRVTDGRLDLSGLQVPGYGYGCEIDWEARTPLADWTFRVH